MSFVAVDWGTSSLRGALIDEAGRVLDERQAPRGILGVPAGGFPAAFDAVFGDWMAPADRRCLISGMAGSRQGWVEAPYCPCPADAADLARHVIPVVSNRIAMVPGLSDSHDGVPDVMRGEEVQIFGAMQLTGLVDGVFVLPGTHNKWVQVQGGRVLGFRTSMTGEFYALLAQHSILSRTVDPTAPLDAEAFAQGLARSARGGGLLHNAFGARTLGLFERMSAAQLASYLSGLLIGEELRVQPLDTRADVVLIGAPALTARYSLALDSLHIHPRVLGAEATWAGAHALHTALSGGDVRFP
ncbi:MAG TPA: 2-dehydro-3-deoxygalactonokinase [Burkholderiaceae bacterium]|nr:2-dehydro-3-deoxygalactonokinase [Burkholderiaceae bacterium]